MKKIIFSLMAAGMAGFLMQASAQPEPPADNNNNTVPPQAPGDNSPAPGPQAASDQPAADQGSAPATDMQAAPDTGNQPMVSADATPATDTTQTGDAAATQTADNAPAEQTDAKGSTITPSGRRSQGQQEVQSNFMPPSQAGTNAIDINLHFNHAPLDMVLNYLSDAAGFIIVQETRINSSVTVTVNGKHLTQDEAVNLLNSVLNQNGYAAIRDNRTLTIVDKADAKTREIPVHTSNNPSDIPKNAEIVTQIIPIRFVEAQQLISDLSSFVSPQATVVANQAGNSIVITDTQANIHHLAEIIRAIDDSAEAETEIKVFHLQYANPNDVATELGNVFPSTSNGSQSPIRFGGPGGFGGRFGGLFGGGGGFGGQGGAGGGAAGGNSSADRIRKATQVTAVADSRIQAVIVTAPKDLMDEIAGMMKDLDVPSDRDQNVYTFNLKNGDAQQVAQVLQNMFQTSSARGATSGQSQNSALQQRSQNSTTQMSSQSSSSGFGSGGAGGGRAGGGGGQY